MADLAQAPAKTPQPPVVDTSAPTTAAPELQPRGNDAAQQKVAGAGPGAEAGGGADAAAGLANYESALGEFLGKKLFDAVSGVLTYDKLSGSAKEAVKNAFGALAGSIGKIDGVEADPKALDNLGQMLDAAAAPSVEKLLEKYGPELTGKLAKWTGAHPRTVLTVALLAAAGAVIANAPIPELKQHFNLGKSVSVDLDAKLGKLRAIALEKVKAKIAYASGPLIASLEVGKEGDATTGEAKVSVGDDGKKVALDGKFDQDGLKVVGLDGHLKIGAGPLGQEASVAGSVSQERGKSAIGSLSLTRKNGQTTETNDFKYDSNTGVLSIGQQSLFQDGDTKVSANLRGNSDGTSSAGMRVEGKEGPISGYGGVEQSTTATPYGMKEEDKVQLGLAYKRSDLTAKLDAQLSNVNSHSTMSGSVEKTWGNSKAGGSFSAVLDDPKMLEVGAFYGFKDPNEFKSFLVEYKHKSKTEDNVLAYTVENTLSDVRLRWQQTLTWGGTSGDHLNTKLQGAKFLSKDTALLAGMEHDYNMGTGKNNFTPQVGVQYKGLPVMLGYDMDKKAVKVGITIPF